MKQARYIKNCKVFPYRYLQMAKAMKSKWENTESKPYTRNQKNFACYLLKNEKDISKIGNMEKVFEDVRNYLRIKK